MEDVTIDVHRSEVLKRMKGSTAFSDDLFEREILEKIIICNLIMLEFITEDYLSERDIYLYKDEIETELLDIYIFINKNDEDMRIIYSYIILMINDILIYAEERELYETCSNLKKLIEYYV